MGAGKTTIGKILASELGYKFIDTDAEVEKKAGADITWIFDVEGEQGFRVRESKALEEIASESNQVISTGGGIILNENNRKIIKDSGVCIYLSASREHLLARIAKDKKRPLLQVDDPGKILDQIIAARAPLYKDVASLVVQTNSRPPRQLVKEIVKNLKKLNES